MNDMHELSRAAQATPVEGSPDAAAVLKSYAIMAGRRKRADVRRQLLGGAGAMRIWRMCSAPARALSLCELLRWRICLLCDPPPPACAVPVDPVAAWATCWGSAGPLSDWAMALSGETARSAPRPIATNVICIEVLPRID